MAEEIQHLLDRIHREGVDKARDEAEAIIREAGEKARQIVEQARDEAKRIREDAEAESRDFEERSRQALHQAARDIIISLTRDLETVVRASVKDAVGKTLDIDVVKHIVTRLADAYVDRNMAEGPVDIFLAEEDLKEMAEFFTQDLRRKFKEGVGLRTRKDSGKGFQFSLRDEDVYHDFTDDAIAEELCRYLGPKLRQTVLEAVGKNGNGRKSNG